MGSIKRIRLDQANHQIFWNALQVGTMGANNLATVAGTSSHHLIGAFHRVFTSSKLTWRHEYMEHPQFVDHFRPGQPWISVAIPNRGIRSFKAHWIGSNLPKHQDLLSRFSMAPLEDHPYVWAEFYLSLHLSLYLLFVSPVLIPWSDHLYQEKSCFTAMSLDGE